MKNIKRYVLIGGGALLLALGFTFPNEDPVLGRIMNPQAVGVAPAVADLDMAGYDITNGGTAAFATTTFSTVVSIGTTTTKTKLDVHNSTATSSAYIYSGGAGLGGRLILEDVGGGACTEVTAKAGVLTAAVVACP